MTESEFFEIARRAFAWFVTDENNVRAHGHFAGTGFHACPLAVVQREIDPTEVPMLSPVTIFRTEVLPGLSLEFIMRIMNGADYVGAAKDADRAWLLENLGVTA